mmetsp:Transcript_69648/g.123592  ORF Transcript_69648/g.123592 Transcript_69648/m.123592 type:complete len:115 (+) Transcript_69648:380-724(+)
MTTIFLGRGLAALGETCKAREPRSVVLVIGTVQNAACSVLPARIDAKSAAPGKTVMAVAGDHHLTAVVNVTMTAEEEDAVTVVVIMAGAKNVASGTVAPTPVKNLLQVEGGVEF